MRVPDELPVAPIPDTAALGFDGDEQSGWLRSLKGRDVQFRLLRTLDDLTQAEQLQEDVFGVTDRDLIPANELIVVAETGGFVIGAFLPGQSEAAAGVLVGWGGFIGRPRVVSDFLAVRLEARNLGLAAEMKRLQAAIALTRGFEEIVWTVDPLRAANARLNFAKLGAIAAGYEIDRYGSTFALRLYGGMPSDRLHVTWRITTPAVIHRLLGGIQPVSPVAHRLSPNMAELDQHIIRIDIPADIDALLVDDLAAALDWRLRVREALLGSFATGFVVTGFQPADGADSPALILERHTLSAG